LVFGSLVEVINLPTFLKFGNTNKPDICVIFAKIMGGHETGEDVEQVGGSPLRPGHKTATEEHCLRPPSNGIL